MTKKALVIGGIAAIALLVGGWAFAQSPGHGPGGMHGMGPDMHGQMGRNMHGMGAGMMGMGPGMMGMHGGSATMEERRDIHELLFNHESIKRSVTNLPDGIRTVTESDDPQLAETIKTHVAQMGQRVEEGRDPDLPMETPALRSIFRNKDKIKSAYEVTEKGVIVVQTSTDALAVKALQDHAAEVSDLARRGMVAAHEAMMRNGGGMMRGMRGDMGRRHNQH
jgi:hypothetical protein